MTLTIIKGPPNSGRTELVRERFEARVTDDPVLVVPSTDDIFGWERRLTRERGAFIGGKVMHFKDLVDEILRAAPTGRERETPVASPLRRRDLAAAAIRAEWPAIAAQLSDQPGLIDAALQTIDEFRENLVGPVALADPETAEAVGPMAGVCLEYLSLLEDAGLTDLPARAATASAIPLGEWQGRHVFVAGFDDLTKRQLEIVRRLAAETEVTVAMTHERGKRAMAVTEGLLGDLVSIGGKVEVETVRPPVSKDHDPLLVELERAFLDRSSNGSLKPGPAVTLIEASGRRGEAEAIGAEIARLIDGGVDPGEIAIAIDAPATNGGPILEVLGEYDIPAGLEAETRAFESATGQAVISLLRAWSPGGSSSDFFSWLRSPIGLDPDLVDAVEFEAIRKGVERASEARVIAERLGLHLPGWELLDAGDCGAAARTVARLCAANLVAGEGKRLPGAAVVNETQMSTAITRAVEELELLGEGRVEPERLVDALNSGVVKTWSLPASRTVNISSPYSMRAKRAGYLFVASLQEKDLGATEGSPLMSGDARAKLEMPDFTDQELQETYLFYSCLAVPTKGIWLSHRVADVHGKGEFPSAMIGEVMRLFEFDGSGLRVIRRASSDIVFPAGRAPSAHEWALSAAASGIEEPPNEAVTDAAEDLAQALLIESSTRQLANVDSPLALAGLAERNIFSASALEAFIECPYKWFFERAMRPDRFGPDPVAIARGNLIHQVLADLYRAHPEGIPNSSDIDSWLDQMRELVDVHAASCDLGDDSAEHRIQREQVSVEIARFLRREATRGNSRFVPIELERKFGFDDEESVPGLTGTGWSLRGIIDRVDRDPDGKGVVIDYKSGSSSYKSLAEMQREGKIQLHLYLKVLEEHWGLDPIAGLYVPVFAAKKAARGLVDELNSAAVKDMSLVSKDFTPDLTAEIEAGFERASIAAGKIMRGEIAHDPSDCLTHFAHAGVPDWQPDPAEEDGPR